VIQFTVIFNQKVSNNIIKQTANVTSNIKQLTVFGQSYGVTGQIIITYQNSQPGK